ncbi:hypothetical protein V2J09_006459 [Rumex salicifolius]
MSLENEILDHLGKSCDSSSSSPAIKILNDEMQCDIIKVGNLVRNKVAASLNSYECYILQTGTSIFIWQGNQSPFEQQQLAVKVAEILKFFSLLLLSASWITGKFQVEEIYNFTQDDLLTEDTLILDTHAEVFVWVGHTVDPKEKQKAFEMGEKYIALAASLEGLPQQVPLYKITEGNEPCFFTTYFSWDSAKAIV